MIYTVASVQMYIFSFFFFFKQKPAYEMRISDWSSDVVLFRSHLFRGKAGDQHLGAPAAHRAGDGGDVRSALSLSHDDFRKSLAERAVVIHFGETEIGRASCRERVCQYV